MTSATQITETPRRKSRWNPWPCAIIAWFVLFAGGLAVWIVVAVRNDEQLVRKDYYEHEVLFQQQIDRLARTAATGDVRLSYESAVHSITIQLPLAHARNHAAGRIHLYRPSDAKLDREMKIALNADGTQRLDVHDLLPGLWKVRLEWTVNGEEFFFDRQVIIAGKQS
jgi:hypothetical protein